MMLSKMGIVTRMLSAFMFWIWLQFIHPPIFIVSMHWLIPHVYIWLLQNQNMLKGTKIELVISIMRNSSIIRPDGMPRIPFSRSKHRSGLPSDGSPLSRHRMAPTTQRKKSPRYDPPGGVTM